MRLVASMWTIPVVLCLSGTAFADDLATPGDAKSLGFSVARLARIAPWYQARFDSFSPSDGLLPGAVVAIAKGGKLAYLQAIGFQDRAETVPMKTNSIFWIASMSKPVTSVAAMILVDEGKLDLDAPVSQYLPELANMRVAFQKTDPATGEMDYGIGLPKPAKHPMTVRDLLRHTSGLIYPELDFAYPERGLADASADFGIRMIHGLYGLRAVRRRDTTLADFVSSLARLPLAHEPGEVHEYGWSVEVLSRVVEVASGRPFDQFLESRIFGPLHMVDTGFFVPKEKLDRLVDSPMPERPPIWDVTTPPKLFSGDGGLVSTAPDYLRFCQMLLNGGELDGVRVLSPHAVKQMTTNALPSGVSIFGGDEVGARAGTTFGLGFAIRTDPVQSWIPGAVGSFSWAGHWSTYFWIDPAEQLIGLQMVQATPGSKGRQAVLYSGINHLVYGALAIPESTAVPPAAPVPLSPEALADYAGTYDFGATVSSRDRQGLADGKTGWLGIGSFVAMGQEGLRINKPNLGSSPAAKAGVTAGDLITEIDGAPLKGLALADVLAKLRGPANSTIKMKIVHKGQRSADDLSIVRATRPANSVLLQLRVEQGKLIAEATGAWPILEFEKGNATPLVATSSNEFTADDEDHTRIAFVRDAAGKVSGLILNPGPWEQHAAKSALGPNF
ncbi:CubicO group peptidase (beta-lactamase class C family) [Bradyrhizobium japonicum]|uniref:serine hydrolase n=1 Tax=Bradyrhizobium japonicum TaxID=375 RepID=UPI002225FA14|nr:serine hydrolase [Bradyrhizobium japonicum]MCW2221153.1 CubicO group peptidase (beta-lactamase class C family) [Bradyrhizobium japonicum]MCW2345765.1 CubicO group peptidase (beta-lactamase class C family) [Bradyrhizobium japonicum]